MLGSRTGGEGRAAGTGTRPPSRSAPYARQVATMACAHADSFCCTHASIAPAVRAPLASQRSTMATAVHAHV
ncbi:MAG: hypothetical protein M5U28_14550 [Sandaracinaceae bacterium]|nr:hypothetical protein [Sandaracinaceae bacterium]